MGLPVLGPDVGPIHQPVLLPGMLFCLLLYPLAPAMDSFCVSFRLQLSHPRPLPCPPRMN